MITGYVNGQTLKLSAPVIAASSVRYLEAQFLFRQSDWDGLSVVRAVFSRKGGTESYSIPLTDGEVLPEDNLNLAEGVWLVHLVGSLYADGELVRRITTEDAELTVKPCSAVGGDPLPDVPPTEAERLWAQLDELKNAIGSGGGSGGGTLFEPGNALELDEGVLNVVTTDTAEAGSDLPITSGAVHTIAEAQQKNIDEKLPKSGWSANKNLGTDENGNIIEKKDIFAKDTSAWMPIEYMTGVSWTELGYFWKTDGTLANTEYTQKYQSTEKLIKIEPNCSYIISRLNGVYNLYDANGKNGISNDNRNPNVPITFETGANQYYIGISHIPVDGFPLSGVSLVRTTISEAEYDALPTKADTLKTLYGKNIVCFGDSLFGMYRGETSTPAYIANHTGATVHNCGFGGCRMSVHPSNGYAAFSMWALAKAIAENDWTTQDEQAESGAVYFPEHLALLKSLDFNAIDIAVIHYGTNDFAAGGGTKIDNPDNPEDYTTLCGALRYSINKLLTAYPKLRVYISLPVYRFWQENSTVVYAEDYVRHSHTLPDFVEALRRVAAEFNLPVIDGYYGLGVNRYNASSFLGDGTHHNADGRKLFGCFIGANLIAQQTTTKSDGYSRKEVDSMIGDIDATLDAIIALQNSYIGGETV